MGISPFMHCQVGINTNNPSATLDLVSKGNTSSTKALKISNSSSLEMVTVRDNGQVGINQATPSTDALLELNSTNKALLLTRVINATDVSTPVNGMLVYDITQKCVRGYENNAWSGCLSASGGSPQTPINTIEHTPCDGLKNVKDWGFSNNINKSYGAVPMFVSEDGYIYGGWGIDNSGAIGYGSTYAGDISNTFAYSSDDLFSAYPAANILKYLPDAKWARIMGTNPSPNYVYGITTDGRMFVWGGRVGTANIPASGNTTIYTTRAGIETPREIINPNNNKWVEFYTLSGGIWMCAVDDQGKWYTWGGLTGTTTYDRVSFAYSPSASNYYYTSPNEAKALVPAPKYDPTVEETIASGTTGYAISYLYIGTDDNVYNFGGSVANNNTTYLTSPQKITLPTGVNPVKIMAGFQANNFLILGNNGIIYRVGNGASSITNPTPSYTALVFTPTTYDFSDFIILGNLIICGVPRNGGDLVTLSYSTVGSSFTAPVINTIPGTSRFNIVKLWTDEQQNIIFKDGTSGNSYIYSNTKNITGNQWWTRAIGFSMSTNQSTTGLNNDPNGVALYKSGPFKIINCVK